MCSSGCHQYDLLTRQQLADAVYDAHIQQLPARVRLADDFIQRFFTHTGVVFQEDIFYWRITAEIAHQADKADQCA